MTYQTTKSTIIMVRKCTEGKAKRYIHMHCSSLELPHAATAQAAVHTAAPQQA